MNTWPLALTLLFLLLMVFPLPPAFIELRLKRDANPLKIGRSTYLDVEGYSRGFENFLRNKFKELIGSDFSFLLPENKQGVINGTPYLYLNHPVARQEIVTDFEKINLFTQKIILSKQDLELPSNMLYENEVFTHGNLYTGRNNYLKAALAHGDVVVQPNTEVLRWISSRGTLKSQGPAVFHGRLSAANKIIMEGDNLYKWMAAPHILINPAITLDNMASDFKDHTIEDNSALREIADVIDISGGTAFIRGDLAAPPNWHTSFNLIATGNITLRDNSCISGKIKANGNLNVGHRCKLLSSAVSSKNIQLLQGTTVVGPLIAEEKIEMIGATVGQEGNMSSVYAQKIELIGFCQIYGSVFAEEMGIIKKA